MTFLNLDAGELDSETEELWSLFDVLACACGGHAGDDRSMARVCAFVAQSGAVALGAHPSYPDREGFGRRSIAIEPAQLTATIADQCRALAAVAKDHGLSVTYVKPHGALYHDAARDPAIADAVIEGAVAALGDVTLIGPLTGGLAGMLIGTATAAVPATRALVENAIAPATRRLIENAIAGTSPLGALLRATTARGIAYAREGFADRRLRADGSLVPRSEPHALIEDPQVAAAQARRLAAHVDTICVHADTPNAIEIARAVREAVR